MSMEPSGNERATAAGKQSRREKVGVIVVHGVGQTTEGWIDSYLVPQLEKWSAYDGVAGLARQQGSFAPANSAKKHKLSADSLVLSAPASDNVWVTVALGHDDDFAAFSRLATIKTGAPDLSLRSIFETPEKRIANRDALYDEISQILKTDTSGNWLKSLRQSWIASTTGFLGESEVSRVRDPESTDPARTWMSFKRRWHMPNRDVVVSEMFWADMSHTGGVILSKLLAMIQLFLEAPFILGRAFLGDADGPFDWIMRKLILSANWIMRWPIAGLNAAVFPACFAAMILHQAGWLAWLPGVTIVTLLGVAASGLWATLKWQHRKPGLADIGLAAFVSALLLAGVVALAWASAPHEAMATPASYISITIRLILLFWFIWGALNVLAILVLASVAFMRGIEWAFKGAAEASKKLAARVAGGDPLSPARRKASSSLPVTRMPLARPGAAIGLGVLIGILWKLTLAILGILVIGNLGITRGVVMESCGRDLSILEIVASAADPCQLAFAEQHLVNVRDLNIAAAILVAFAIYIVVRWRRVRVATFPGAAQDGTLVLPRLIAHNLLIFVLCAVSLTNAAVFYALPYFLDVDVPMQFSNFVFGGGNIQGLPASLGLMLFIAVLIYVAEHSNDIIHIGRDLVDHQYSRDPETGSVKLQYALSRMATRLTRGKWETEPPDARRYFGRRRRIQRRLEALIDDLMENEDIDRLIFLAHSQGTVIVRDYLTGHDDLVDPEHRQRVRGYSERLKRIDVMTIGSPLTHIYEHYYADYEPPYIGTSIFEADSWTNMWRVDDPIGQDVSPPACIKAGGETFNIGIGPGGHTNYWKEPEVCTMLWALIEQPKWKASPEWNTMPQILGLGRMPNAQSSGRVQKAG